MGQGAGGTRLDAEVDSTDADKPLTLEEKEAAYEKFVWDNLKRNYLGNYLHGMLGNTGFRLVNAPTFLPAYLHAISGSSSIVGLGLALQQLGGILTPIFGATRVEHKTKVMPDAMLIGGIARLAVLGMGVAGWVLKGQALVVAILAMMLMFGVFMGVQRVVFSVLMAKVIPLQRRGRLQAWRNATGGLIAAIVAYAAGKYFIEPNLFGHGYSVTFILAFVLTSAGISAFSLLLREPEPPTLRPPTPFRQRLTQFPRLIRSDRDYAMFLVVQMLATSSRIATPFYIIYVGQTTHLGGAEIGLLSLAFLGADTLANLVWGYTGDKTGFRQVLLVSLLLWTAATVLLMSSHAMPAAVIAFFGLGAAQSGYMMAAQTMILEFGSREELAMRIAISTTAESITSTLSPLAGGLMADHLGFHWVFGVSIGFLVAALILLVTSVKEPRRILRTKRS
jgi:MFS family permease